MLLQNYPNLEYIVIDGGSTDSSTAIIRRYAQFLSHWVSEPDRGQANAINKGFQRSTGDIMGWLNSDDILLPSALQRIALAFMRNPAVMITTGFRKYYDADSRFLFNYFDGIPDRNTLRLRCNISQETTYWRRPVWDQVGLLDESFQFAMDYDYWQRMLDAGFTFEMLPYYLGGFRYHPASKGAQWNHIRDTELALIYQKRQLAANEPDAFARLDDLLGKEWRQKLRLMKDLGHQSLSNSPRLLLAIFRLLDIPILSTIIMGLHRTYSKNRGRFIYE